MDVLQIWKLNSEKMILKKKYLNLISQKLRG